MMVLGLGLQQFAWPPRLGAPIALAYYVCCPLQHVKPASSPQRQLESGERFKLPSVVRGNISIVDTSDVPGWQLLLPVKLYAGQKPALRNELTKSHM